MHTTQVWQQIITNKISSVDHKAIVRLITLQMNFAISQHCGAVWECSNDFNGWDAFGFLSDRNKWGMYDFLRKPLPAKSLLDQSCTFLSDFGCYSLLFLFLCGSRSFYLLCGIVCLFFRKSIWFMGKTKSRSQHRFFHTAKCMNLYRNCRAFSRIFRNGWQALST